MARNILNLMAAQHGLIEAMLFVFKDEAKHGRKIGKRSLAEMEWEFKKHFFIEESAIFDYLPFADQKISEMIGKIRKEHIIILKQVGVMWKKFPNKTEFEEFYNKIKEHRLFEEQKLYPLLDKRLTEQEKEIIAARINEIPLKS